jgi:hypothetical protein
MNPQTALPAYSRRDLDLLTTFDRDRITSILRSFDDRDLSDDAFVLRVTELLAPDTVPGLAEAIEAQDALSVSKAIYKRLLPLYIGTGPPPPERCRSAAGRRYPGTPIQVLR